MNPFQKLTVIVITIIALMQFSLAPVFAQAGQEQSNSVPSVGVAAGCGRGRGFISTAIGCIPFGEFTTTAAFFFRWALGIAGGITMLFIIYSGFLIMTSTGDPKRLQSGHELLTSAIGGILVIIFSVFILRTLGVYVIGIL